VPCATDQYNMFDERRGVMAWAKDYLFSITTAAMICGIPVVILGKKGGSVAVINLICGLFLTFTVIRPIVNIRINDLSIFAEDISSSAENAVADGERMAEKTMTEIIKARTQTYILDKAAALGLTMEVEVNLDGMIPTSVILKGSVSPYNKAQLTTQIAHELGISPEDQQWIS